MASLFDRIQKAFRAAEKPAPAVVPRVDDSLPAVRPIFSFIVDAAPRFAYQGYHLAHSLLEHSAENAGDIHVQVTAQVSQNTRKIFTDLGCHVHEIQRFGDGKYSNKLSQLPNLLPFDCDRIVLLDTDMIVVDDLRPLIRPDALLAKTIDISNPSMQALGTIAHSAAMRELPSIVGNDIGDGSTYLGNCNGGFYSVPRRLVQPLSDGWQKWGKWLLQNKEPLVREKRTNHVDQVSMWLAIHMEKIPFGLCSSNLNYFVHVEGEHRYYDPTNRICVLHYHDVCLNRQGLIEPDYEVPSPAADAIAKANAQFSQRPDQQLLSEMIDEIFSVSFKRPKPKRGRKKANERFFLPG